MTERKQIPIADESIEGLDTILVGPVNESRPKALVILLHGFGANGRDLVPCAPEMISDHEEMLDVAFAFPQAPMDLAAEGMPGSFAWWPINMAKLMEIFEVANFSEMASVMPEELPERSDQVVQLIEKLAERFSLPLNQIVLGGFSQGAMLATDVALRLQGKLGGLIIWSGTFIAQPRWTQFCEACSPIKMVQSHGKFDNVLPYFAAENLRDFLQENGHDISFYGFDGFHQTDFEAIQASTRLVLECIK